MRRKSLGIGLTIAVIGAVVLVPGLGRAGQTAYECGRKTSAGQVCVRAVNEDPVILCDTDLAGRPTCIGFAVIGGEAFSPTGDGMQMMGDADIYSGPVDTFTWGNISVPLWLRRAYDSETWGIFSYRGYGPRKFGRPLFTQRAYGPRGGCLTYKLQVTARASASTRTGCFGIQQCINDRTYVPPVQHVHTVSKRHCVQGV